MFKSSKYTDWYWFIISKAKSRNIEGYTESHHIIPRCLGGSDHHNNLVNLTAREHFICHWLLTKMHDSKKLRYAFTAMSMHKGKRQLKSRYYEILARESSKLISERNSTTEPWNKGKGGSQIPWNKGLKGSQKAWNKGKKEDPYVTKKRVRARKENGTYTPWNKGLKGSQKAWNKGVPAPSWKCEHCGKEGAGTSNYNRWHGPNCRSLLA